MSERFEQEVKKRFPRLNNYTEDATHKELVAYTEKLIDWTSDAEEKIQQYFKDHTNTWLNSSMANAIQIYAIEYAKPLLKAKDKEFQQVLKLGEEAVRVAKNMKEHIQLLNEELEAKTQDAEAWKKYWNDEVEKNKELNLRAQKPNKKRSNPK